MNDSDWVGLIPLDGRYRGNMVRTEVMSCPPGDRGVPLGCVLQFIIHFCVHSSFIRRTEFSRVYCDLLT